MKPYGPGAVYMHKIFFRLPSLIGNNWLLLATVMILKPNEEAIWFLLHSLVLTNARTHAGALVATGTGRVG
ncbi:hypothetical protein BDA96_09G230600 [Sorghum bicolor]|uniref:Uncharacterized protein n=2 Tax=Sorghum bicolor TaxID=4558 RepID=A0A921QEN2_SORBI|nr:hypothetical protein BDA96_09G230600 [Sorghum bicolor]KXG22461.1 hypothetical protein SORBI_3009G217800 [Sorghum bicolor]